MREKIKPKEMLEIMLTFKLDSVSLTFNIRLLSAPQGRVSVTRDHLTFDVFSLAAETWHWSALHRHPLWGLLFNVKCI